MARKKLEMERGIYTEEEVNVYIDIAANTGLSKNTVRNAFCAASRYRNAPARILGQCARMLGFVRLKLKPDRRGRPAKALQLIEQIQKISWEEDWEGG